MTITKSIRNVQNTLDSTVNSAIQAADELAKIPVLFRKVEAFGLSGKPIIENSADLDNYVTQLMNLDSSSQKAAQSMVVLDGSMKTLFKQDVAGLQSGQKINAQLFERTLAVTELNAVQQKQIVSDAKLIDAKERLTIKSQGLCHQNQKQ